MATVSTVAQVALPFEDGSDIDELDVIGVSTRSTTVVGDATPPDDATRKLKPDTLIIPARRSKRTRVPSLTERNDPHAGTQKKQKMETKKGVSASLRSMPRASH